MCFIYVGNVIVIVIFSDVVKVIIVCIFVFDVVLIGVGIGVIIVVDNVVDCGLLCVVSEEIV